MSLRPNGPQTSQSDQDVVDPQLLAGVRAYLGALRDRRRPDAQFLHAWEQFYFICDPLLRSYVAVAGVAQRERADCLQEAWLRLVKELPSFNYDASRAPFFAWLRVVARNTAIDRMRRAARGPATQELGHRPDQLTAPHAAPSDNHGDESEASERAYRLLNALANSVSATNYQIARLRWVEGLSVTAVATRFGLTAHQVSARLHRMKRVVQGGLKSEPDSCLNDNIGTPTLTDTPDVGGSDRN